LNGVINCGGGIMGNFTNIISDVAPTPSFAVGDEDLYIDDDLELGANGQGYKPGGGSWAAVSDARLKQDVRPFEDGLEEVLRIRPVRYRYTEEAAMGTEREFIGVTAQDMLEVAPYMVEEKPLRQVVMEDEQGRERILEEGERYYTFDPSALDYLLINAVREQQAIIEELRAEIAELKADR
jgi:hypothetical protein